MDLLYVFNKHFFENEYMHFGYWEPSLELKYLNLKQAQLRYVEEIFKLVPADAATILDVGCGSGEMALQLIAKGRRVDCVCPPTVLSHFAKEKLAGRATVFECKFEDLEVPRQYDLVYFSESFQFIDLRRAMEQCRRYASGYVLVADVFKKDAPERGPIGSGHRYSEFLAMVEEFGFKEISNIDVTEFIAPSFDLEAQLLAIVDPLTMVSNRMLTGYKRALARFVMFLNRKKIRSLRTKYLDNSDRNRHSFARYKTYRFVLLRV